MADKLIKLTSGEKYSVEWLKNEMFQLCPSMWYASFRVGVNAPYTITLSRETLRTQGR